MAIHPETTVTTERVYTGKVVTLRKDTVRTGNGGTAIREIVEHAPVVVMVPVTADGEILLIRQFRKPVERVLFEVPAGLIEPGESIETAARREMVEETGYEPATMELLTSIYPSPGMTDELMHIFRVSDLQGSGIPTEPDDELETVRMSLSEARSMVTDGRIQDAKTVIGILLLDESITPTGEK